MLPRNRVLLFLSFRLLQGDRTALSCQWLRDPPPPLPPSELELLRLEYVLAPATKAAGAERALQGALRRVASLVGLSAPNGVQLCQVQVAHGVVYAVLGSPGRLPASG